jgi:ParB-like chromosome segregation protein Spo0J
MLKNIALKDIKPNPFNARMDYDEQAISELAKEIDAVGLWPALRGRELKDGKVELCFGHRRLMALKKLKHPPKEVAIDIVDLSDEEMMEQGLIENFQRYGLNDMEKASGIKQLVDQLVSTNGGDKGAAYERVRILLGYQTVDPIKHLVVITTYSEPVKKLIAQRKISGKTAIHAQRLGGDNMVKTAVEQNLSQHTIEKLSQSLEKIPDPKVKEKIREQVVAGKITKPEEVGKKAEAMLQAKAERGKPPEDLLVVIIRWTSAIKDWRKALTEVIPYRNYLDKAPQTAKEFRSEVKGLISDLEKLLEEDERIERTVS